MDKSNKFDVRHIADLAGLNLQKKDYSKFEKQLSLVVNYFEEIKKVNTDDVEPTSQTTGLTDVLRIDLIRPEDQLSVSESTSNTDKTHNNYFVVSLLLTKE
ncbi:MAG: Aspartyl/glutamyl-tRNA(Asn/Gln) amidotransferase subunit C [Candidatus Woesebacteria bacterium GW2011_GWB1_43_14]|uniref:Aspartyl/glutamyl-tRNA(Asn/Gln) amidotransferase subunit C n=1 Tax=Candidatus Woesebacteria bacterium GW2011_GWB1_43_14 TaxID=1618578 RepID=A0A0G1DGZ9_9BACT|nr:MAG: Aspartyl/glutamyl-tRNA(Asn/Gln) amidotransferase subunit C [Candidatus Woesebacteria bacterium GW2011_GWA1_39_11b]KKS78469.1 MAG: Aspartyl/glutamyl-tRNA(Asn/Gln) amidotransferase subunit C [Candidatus Woesebacteria bacterium GW2011_GWC1_42_9]KKS97115.1 MAG: Aspartyl/glutamyl-tRNA(Asn/Gln) amidotransferase subunit C [Candidatus Woesebacteria bacterium GW2011_GWB1_43_14]